jgi:HEAT repeat protein
MNAKRDLRGAQPVRAAQAAPRIAHCGFAALLSLLVAAIIHAAQDDADPKIRSVRLTIPHTSSVRQVFTGLEPGRPFGLSVSLDADDLPRDRCRVEITAPGIQPLRKTLHVADPDVYLTLRFATEGDVVVELVSENAERPIPVWVECELLAIAPDSRASFEAEPNDDWRSANELVLGQPVYASADDLDYVDGATEGATGTDWYRFEVSQSSSLVLFALDFPDQEVAANIAIFTRREDGSLEPYDAGRDPTEVVHDRERERFSKQITRTLEHGVYYIRVDARHPAYILRTTCYGSPPYGDPALSVRTGLHYLLGAGDAWFAQIPRGGHRYSRSQTLHETATRCTACHASVFPLEAALTAKQHGHSVPAPEAARYLAERLYDSVTPLYGSRDVHWQRYIGIPLQSQGLGGTTLIDYERYLSGTEHPSLLRFGAFLREAWASRRTLPEDESNAVVPLESKFELAWRAWKVLREMAHRTGDIAYEAAALNIEALTRSEGSDARVETLQDRLHRLYGWSLMQSRSTNRVQREVESLLELQNADGGWHEEQQPGASSVYATGQMVWTLLSAGVSRGHGSIASAVHFLLQRQRSFGGWFEEANHETFRTPMRETRYAVMALAAAHPRFSEDGASSRSSGTERTAGSSLSSLLECLEGVGQVPDDYPGARPIEAEELTRHASTLVRAEAARALGHSAEQSATATLVALLDDRSKLVRHAAAWSLRQRGNRGLGVEDIRSALRSTRWRVRRSAVQVFAQQFHGMDQSADVLGDLLHLMADGDPWVRVQTTRSLRQWFYRQPENSERLRIVNAFIQRMEREPDSRIRESLSRETYLMLDENLGGDSSLQRNLLQLPEDLGLATVRSREQLERDVLALLLDALRTGSAGGRTAVLSSFDGSFLDGREFARRPSNAVDIGNDREFGFLHAPASKALESALSPALADATLPSSTRRMAIQLADYFMLPRETRDTTVRLALLDALDDPDESVRAAARGAIADLRLDEAGPNSPEVQRIAAHLERRGAAMAPLAGVLARAPKLLEQPALRSQVERLLSGDAAAVTDLTPVLANPVFETAWALSLLPRLWEKDSVSSRLQALDVLESRLEAPAEATLSVDAARLLELALGDPSFVVRERAIAFLERVRLDASWTPLLSRAIGDPVYVNRWRALKLVGVDGAFWTSADSRAILDRLLADESPSIRGFGLSVVERHPQLLEQNGISSRVGALTREQRFATQATALLDESTPRFASRLHASGVSRRQLPSIEHFREHVNPLFYEEGLDGMACADCHATHSALQLTPRVFEPRNGMDELLANYGSALRVIDLVDPYESALVRKPVSPGSASSVAVNATTDAELTHGGGLRWPGQESQMQAKIAAWIETSRLPAAAASGHVLSARQALAAHGPELAGDGDTATSWIAGSESDPAAYPAALTVDLREFRWIRAALYAPGATAGRVRQFSFHVSTDGRRWSSPVASGIFADSGAMQYVGFEPQMARFVQLRVESAYAPGTRVSVSELRIESERAPATAFTTRE